MLPSACRPPPDNECVSAATLLANADSPMALAVLGDSVFWADYSIWRSHGSIWRVSKSGGVAENLASNINPLNIKADPTHLYWTNTVYNGSVQKMSLSGGEILSLAGNIDLPSGLGFINDRIYFVDGSGAVFSVAKVGGDQTLEIASTNGFSAARLTTSTSHIYWALADNSQPAYLIFRASAVDKVPTLLVSQGHLGDMAVDATHLYWTDMGVGGPDTGRIMKMRLDDQVITVLADNQPKPLAIAVDASFVYWTNMIQIDGGNISKVPIEGSEVTILADCLDGPNDIAVDDTHVYWTNLGQYDGGSVMRTPK